MFFSCVTTRRLCGGAGRDLTFLRGLGRACLPLASLPFRLGMPPTPFGPGAALLLTLGCLPASQRLPAFRIVAVALVLPPRLESPPAAFAETPSPPQPPAPGGHTALLDMLNWSHGSC